jgi:translation initiation factor 5A
MSDSEEEVAGEQEEVEQTQFETADAGASHTYPQTASAVRKGAYMVIKGRPCKARSRPLSTAAAA